MSESRLMTGLLNAIEKAGNRLSEPALIFFYFLLAVMGLSEVLSMMTFDVINPMTQEAVKVNTLFLPSR